MATWISPHIKFFFFILHLIKKTIFTITYIVYSKLGIQDTTMLTNNSSYIYFLFFWWWLTTLHYFYDHFFWIPIESFLYTYFVDFSYYNIQSLNNDVILTVKFISIIGRVCRVITHHFLVYEQFGSAHNAIMIKTYIICHIIFHNNYIILCKNPHCAHKTKRVCREDE